MAKVAWAVLILLLLCVQSLEFRELTEGCPLTGGVASILVAGFGLATVIFLLCAALLSAFRSFMD